MLAAPFRGRIASRAVENFEEVIARQTIIWLQNIDELDIVIDLPESVVRGLQGPPTRDNSLAEGETAHTIRAYAQFEGHRDTRYPLRPKEVATKADEQTQTFRATFTMDAPEEFPLLPGMTGDVILDLSHAVNKSPVKWVPVRAVQADEGLAPRVWVLDGDSMTVSSQSVEVGRMSGGSIQVTSGLDGGEEIVAIGAAYLAEGMRVTRMAENRAGCAPRGRPPVNRADYEDTLS